MNIKFKPNELNYKTFCRRAYEDDPKTGYKHNMCPDGIDDHEALALLKEYFWPEGYYLNYSASHSQENTEFVAYMLERYDKDKKLNKKVADALRSVADKIGK